MDKGCADNNDVVEGVTDNVVDNVAKNVARNVVENEKLITQAVHFVLAMTGVVFNRRGGV